MIEHGVDLSMIKCKGVEINFHQGINSNVSMNLQWSPHHMNYLGLRPHCQVMWTMSVLVSESLGLKCSVQLCYDKLKMKQSTHSLAAVRSELIFTIFMTLCWPLQVIQSGRDRRQKSCKLACLHCAWQSTDAATLSRLLWTWWLWHTGTLHMHMPPHALYAASGE